MVLQARVLPNIFMAVAQSLKPVPCQCQDAVKGAKDFRERP